ncbi:3-hydroxybutyryl-CoA dehydrogenase [Peribacillus frigoritolerans]|uniref:3-hydroxybutyryl-CoA dehydrogenase n=1 Tax=Peribacillus frigoritolerans TaxID=450367 RepID=UPI002E1C1215|nr:3-hydroxybutyryl-CoA dehydrogenase [Peribacillus frigoritolerans]MED4697227.1 3-hydroxybutyryl-CoA dehydrogenase [Peribacillus frigoritolerans]
MKLGNKAIFIAGAGRMGRGIALTLAYHGFQVTLIDIKNRNHEEFERLKSIALAEIKSQLKILALSNVFPNEMIDLIVGRIEVCHMDHQPDIWQEADIVFEALPEILSLKKVVYRQICSTLPKETLIASTTSSFSVNTLAEFVTHKDRFINTHWLNPAYLIPLVEVSPSIETSDQSLKEMFQLLEGIGKVPIKCEPSPGFIVPRIQALAMNEASRLVKEGVASIEDIDKASRVGFGLRFAVLGLLEFIDWGGADTLYHASNYLKDSLKSNRFAPSEMIEEKMKSGDIGLKVKKGFYHFEETSLDQYQLETLQKFIDLLQHLGFITSPKDISSVKEDLNEEICNKNS